MAAHDYVLVDTVAPNRRVIRSDDLEIETMRVYLDSVAGLRDQFQLNSASFHYPSVVLSPDEPLQWADLVRHDVLARSDYLEVGSLKPIEGGWIFDDDNQYGPAVGRTYAKALPAGGWRIITVLYFAAYNSAKHGTRVNKLPVEELRVDMRIEIAEADDLSGGAERWSYVGTEPVYGQTPDLKTLIELANDADVDNVADAAEKLLPEEIAA